MGLRRGYINRSAIVHTDCNSQYSSNDIRQMVEDRMVLSMSGKGNCYGNATTEIYTKIFDWVEQVRRATFTISNAITTVSDARQCSGGHPEFRKTSE